VGRGPGGGAQLMAGRFPTEAITTKDRRYRKARKALDEPGFILTEVAAILLGISETTALKWAKEDASWGCGRDEGGRGPYLWPVNPIRVYLRLEPIFAEGEDKL